MVSRNFELESGLPKEETGRQHIDLKEYKEKYFELEHKYHNKIHKLEKENNYLHKIINKFWNTLEKFISWICKKFDIAEEDNLVRDFQNETNTFIDSEKQIKHEEREKE